MANLNRKTLVYEDFTKGEFGTIAPDKAPDGSWTGTNVVVYRDGTIGPRPGLRQIPVTDLPEGEIQGIGFVPTPGADVSAIWFIIGDEVWFFRASGPALDASKAFSDLDQPVDEGAFVWWKESVRQVSGVTYFTVPGDQGYGFSITDATLDNIPDMPAGTDIETYKDRLLVAQGGTSPRIYFSASGEFNDWSEPENFFDVGYAWPVLSMLEFNDSLVIFTSNGVWLLTGGSPDSWVLRRVSNALPCEAYSVTFDEKALYYIPTTRNAPVVFTGTTGDELALKHLEEWKSRTASTTAIQVYGNRDILFTSSDGKSLWRKNSAWTKHDYSIDVGPYQVRYFDDHAVLTDGGSEGEEPNFYTLAMNIDRPAFTSDTFAQPGDDTDTPMPAEFTLPEFLAPVGEDVSVRHVVVDFTKYATGAPFNRIDVTAEAFSQYRRHDVGDKSSTQFWTEDQLEASTGGVRDRHVFSFARYMGGGFRLKFSELRGVKIHRIVVHYDQRDGAVAA